MNTVLPASLAPTGTIRWLPTLPKCTGSRLWQSGQTLVRALDLRTVGTSAESAAAGGEGGRQRPGEPGPVAQYRVDVRGRSACRSG